MRLRPALAGVLHLALVTCAPSSRPGPEAAAPAEIEFLYLRKGKPR